MRCQILLSQELRQIQLIFLAQQTTTFWEKMVVGKLRVKTRHFHETATRIVFLIFLQNKYHILSSKQTLS